MSKTDGCFANAPPYGIIGNAVISIFRCSAATFDRFDFRIAASDEIYTVFLPGFPRFEQTDVGQIVQSVRGTLVFAMMARADHAFKNLKNPLANMAIDNDHFVTVALLSQNSAFFVDVIRRGLIADIAVLVLKDEPDAEGMRRSLAFRRREDQGVISLEVEPNSLREGVIPGYIVENEQTHVAVVLRSDQVLNAAGKELIKHSPDERLLRWVSGQSLAGLSLHRS